MSLSDKLCSYGAADIVPVCLYSATYVEFIRIEAWVRPE